MRVMQIQTIASLTVTALAWAWITSAKAADAPRAEETSVAAAIAVKSTTQPTTAPASVPIQGTVTISSTLDLQKADLSRIVVYVAPDKELDALPMRTDRPAVSQRNKQFSPNFLVVRRGTDVEFPNYDHFDHNVFSRSKAAPAFDLDRYPYGQSKSRVFDKLGVVQVFCNVHPSMRAIIFVAPNDYFCRAGGDGHFTLKGLAPGRYELVAWHERCDEQRKWVDTRLGAVGDITFALELSRKSILANDPPGRRAGYGVERGLGLKQERLDLPVVQEVHAAPPPGTSDR